MRTLSIPAAAGGPAAFLIMLAGCTTSTRFLPNRVYEDRLAGAWVGQMAGVAYGAPVEFRIAGRIDDGELPPWQPERIANAIEQDDLYVEMTWLRCLEQHGLDVTPAQAAAAFAATEYPLWHANEAGRSNVRAGLLPPASGQPEHNPHWADIDFQIEADALGILCPGLPGESVRLGETFGRIMNDGDGLYGGLFMQGMYCAAYFEQGEQGTGNREQGARTGAVERVIEAGLACIPADSSYARCIRDVIAWHRENPHDWRATWQRIEDRYNDDRDCMPGDPKSINAHLNGAYVVMGLLYGGDDFWRVCEIATRCGQDSDCNPSSAAGVWGCLHGLKAIPPEARAGLPAIADRKFLYTPYSYNELLRVCRTLTEQIVRRAGGRVRSDGFEIPVAAAAPRTAPAPSKTPAAAPPTTAATPLLPGITLDRASSVLQLDGTFCLQRGILEYLAVAGGGKEYESLFALSSRPSHVHMALLLAGHAVGELPAEARGDFAAGQTRPAEAPPLRSTPPPASGPAAGVTAQPTRVTIDVEVRQPDGTWIRRPVERFLLDRRVGRPPERLSWAFTGSYFEPGESSTGTGGGTPDVFAADLDRSVIALWYDPTALLNLTKGVGNPYRGDASGLETNPATVPQRGTPARLILMPEK